MSPNFDIYHRFDNVWFLILTAFPKDLVLMLGLPGQSEDIGCRLIFEQLAARPGRSIANCLSVPFTFVIVAFTRLLFGLCVRPANRSTPLLGVRAIRWEVPDFPLSALTFLSLSWWEILSYIQCLQESGSTQACASMSPSACFMVWTRYGACSYVYVCMRGWVIRVPIQAY